MACAGLSGDGVCLWSLAQVYGHRNAILFAATAMCIGLFLCQSTHTPRTFGIESSFMAIALVFVYLTLKLPESRPNTSNRSAKKIEYLSSSLLLLSVAVPLFALNLGGEVFKWGHPVVITMFCLSPFLVALFYYADTRLASTPIVPKRFVQDRNIAIALACTLPMKFVFDQLRFSFGTYLQARSFGKDSSFDDWALTCVYLGRALGTIGYQPLLYAFFGLSQAVSGDLGIAISLAAEDTLPRGSELHQRAACQSPDHSSKRLNIIDRDCVRDILLGAHDHLAK
ncbi:putative Uncharacterized MFS-type transporter C3E7.06c [Glarea lozoyensis 74030]|uniref:Putative Uncharacterized MFS-type transporter C3E7.06c n=1 Tax=Glarea lozoyensis (strain ATCC 74030 / MF5533) TaxID=1104152 RepID=H0ENM4_GLAL7|nr:putative Uncharacterized MFS-type transporter C3E7.06c [Glarea lozoyensis 74030]